MNFLKKFLGSSPKGELAIIPSGQLYLRRAPGSPKSASECLYTDAVASIRETSAPHNYLLVVQRAYQEGEEQLKEDEDDDDDFNSFKDEKVSLIDKSIHIHKLDRSGSLIVSWINTEGDEGERFEFVVDENIKSSEVDQFMKTIYACCYERKYQKSSVGATQIELDEFIYDPYDDELTGLTSGISSLATTPDFQEVELEDDENDSIFEDAEEITTNNQAEEKRLTGEPSTPQSILAFNVKDEVTGDILSLVKSELRLYDPVQETFALQEKEATITIRETGKWEYWLSIKGGELELGTSITSELDPYFDDNLTSVIFVYKVEDAAFSILLRFADSSPYNVFKETFLRANWEAANESKWEKAGESERKYILEAFDANEQDEDMKDFYEDEVSEGEDEEEDAGYDDRTKYTNLRTGLRKETLSDSEDDEEDNIAKKNYLKGSQNKNLTVAYKNDRSYVTRDDRIGVFKTTDDDDLEFATSIGNLTIDGKKKISPTKMMLHTEDRSLVMQGDQKDTLYRMDLEKGKIVDEWKISDDLPVVEFGPSKKFNQMTGEQTFLGISSNGLFKIDPRLSGKKLVESEYKSYFSKNDFSSFGTTENGYIAVASNKGDIRLHDRLGIKAKSLIPAIGDAILHVEISADGKWLLATCKTYLILIDLTIKNGTNAGSLGFQKSFGKATPKARTLSISGEHVAHIVALTGDSLNFTKAHFNTGLDTKEQTIVSSSGPYAITWSLKKILRGDAEPYLIKRYSSNVVADNFKFGTDKNVIIALEDDVGMVNKKEFRKASRNSLAFTPRKI